MFITKKDWLEINKHIITLYQRIEDLQENEKITWKVLITILTKKNAKNK